MTSIARLAAAPLVLVLSGCFVSGDGGSSFRAAHQAFHRSFAGPGVDALRVGNISGFIHVDAWKKPSVQIDAVKYGASQTDLDRVSIEASNENGAVTVRTAIRQNAWFGNHGGSVDYTIHAPAGIAVSTNSVSGDVVIRGLHGRLDVSNVSGDTKVAEAQNDLKINTVSGDGDARFRRMAGSQHVTVSSVSGAVTLHVPKDASADVDVSSISGDFHTPFHIDQEKRTVGVHASGKIGGGSASIRMMSVSGDLSILSQ